MSSISYIIASYSHRSDINALQIQLEQLRIIFQSNIKKNNIKNIIVVCPEPFEKRNHSYYQYDNWIDIFNSFQIPIYFIDFVGNNEHFSYDQWLFGYLYDKTSDYYIFIEDDYCIDKHNLQFDTELIQLYKNSFSNGLGYLCTVALTSPILHGSVSNGMISKKTFEKMQSKNGDILKQFYDLSSSSLEKAKFQYYYKPNTGMIHPQITFSYLFIKNGINIKDMQSNYICPFWNSGTKLIQTYSNKTKKPTKYNIIPIQMVLV